MNYQKHEEYDPGNPEITKQDNSQLQKKNVLNDFWTPVEKLFREWQANKNLELEIRLGTISTSGMFVNGVDKNFFEYFQKVFAEKFPFKCYKIKEIIYSNQIQYRQSDQNPGIFMTKHKKGQHDVFFPSNQLSYPFRFSLKTETLETKNVSLARFFRFLMRNSFQFDHFRLDFSRVLEGNSLKEIKDGNIEEKYEIEVEFMHNTEIYINFQTFLEVVSDLISGLKDCCNKIKEAQKKQEELIYNQNLVQQVFQLFENSSQFFQKKH